MRSDTPIGPERKVRETRPDVMPIPAPRRPIEVPDTLPPEIVPLPEREPVLVPR